MRIVHLWARHLELWWMLCRGGWVIPNSTWLNIPVFVLFVLFSHIIVPKTFYSVYCPSVRHHKVFLQSFLRAPSKCVLAPRYQMISLKIYLLLFNQYAFLELFTRVLCLIRLETVVKIECSYCNLFPIRGDLDLQYPGKLLRESVFVR